MTGLAVSVALLCWLSSLSCLREGGTPWEAPRKIRPFFGEQFGGKGKKKSAASLAPHDRSGSSSNDLGLCLTHAPRDRGRAFA